MKMITVATRGVFVGRCRVEPRFLATSDLYSTKFWIEYEFWLFINVLMSGPYPKFGI